MCQNKDPGFYSVTKGGHTGIFMSRKVTGSDDNICVLQAWETRAEEGGGEVVARVQVERNTLQLQGGCRVPSLTVPTAQSALWLLVST